MTHNNYIYIAVMALVSYAIRILPLDRKSTRLNSSH